MKFKNISTLVVGGLLGLTALTSCNDYLTVYPKDLTLGYNYWKKAADVQEVAAGAYKQMVSGAVEERAIVWGTYRSDEVNLAQSNTNTDLINISAVNLLPTQGLCDWSSYYNVINRCNIVLNHAQHVLDIDPDFTTGDYEVVRGNMLALRSLCYFYLVRAFRDVPYSRTSFEDDDHDMDLPQLAPDSVLQYCINDCQEAEGLVMKSGAYGLTDWHNWGYFTVDAVDALLADIYLWRASMTHSRDDYQQCVNYCDKVIASKDAYYKKYLTDRMTVDDPNDIYHLYPGGQLLQNVIINGNSREGILELQYDGQANSNTTLCDYLYRTGDNSSNSTFMASQLFNSVDANANTPEGTKFFSTIKDQRYWNYLFNVNNNQLTEQNIRKFGNATGSNVTIGTEASHGQTLAQGGTRRHDNFTQNWIVYRLTDVMLMKAEALVQLSQADNDDDLHQAFNLVQTVNRRSVATRGITTTDTLHMTDYPTKEQMEVLVLNERERELCFEGKRWFDLVRYCYRHMDGVDIHTKMADQTSWPALYPQMISMVDRKYVSGGDVFQLKMKSEPFLYWPVNNNDTKINPNLKDNPVFVDTKSSTKNY